MNEGKLVKFITLIISRNLNKKFRCSISVCNRNNRRYFSCFDTNLTCSDFCHITKCCSTNTKNAIFNTIRSKCNIKVVYSVLFRVEQKSSISINNIKVEVPHIFNCFNSTILVKITKGIIVKNRNKDVFSSFSKSSVANEEEILSCSDYIVTNNRELINN